MDETAQKIAQLETKIDAIYTSVEKTRKYFRVTLWVTIILVVAPLILSVFIVPTFLNSYLGSFDDSYSDSGRQSQLDQLKDLLQ